MVGEGDAAVVEEVREYISALKLIEAGLIQFIAAGQPVSLLGKPDLEIGYQCALGSW